MQSGLTWYKRDPRRFLDGVQGLGPEVIGAYAVLLDLIYARGGETRRDDRHLSGILGCSVRKARALTDTLIDAGKLTVEGDFITNSRAKREAKSSRTVSELRANAGRKGGEKSGQSRKNKALGEANARSKTNQIREEKSIETTVGTYVPTSVSITPPAPCGAAPPQGGEPSKPPPEKRGTRLSEDWTLPDDWRAWAIAEGWSPGQVAGEAAKFRDYWISASGQNARKRDWQAVWRNWMRKLPKHTTTSEQPRRLTDGRSSPDRASDAEIARRAAERFARMGGR